MKKRQTLPLMLFVLLTSMIAAAAFVSPAWAAVDPFMEVPAGHWAYETISRLGEKGLIDVSSLNLKDGRLATRYELASVIARGVSTIDVEKLDGRDREILRRLVAEFKAELDALGADYARLYRRDRQLSEAESLPRESKRRPNGIGPQSSGAASLSIGLSSAGFADDNRHGRVYSYSSPGPLRQGAHFSAPETARYASYDDNPVKLVARDPLSTFSLDVNTTSYANVRRFLNAGRLPNPDAVRIEELINYFPATTETPPEPLPGSPFRVAYELAPCPWNDNNALLWVSLTAQSLDYEKAPPANLVFLVDVSGSMAPPERLPLVKSALKTLAGKMRPEDKISLVTYAGSTSVVLKATPGKEKGEILSAIDRLGAGGSTAGAAGLALAYEQARKGFIKGGINRILLCTDGDFNVGVSSSGELEAMVKKERESGITLSVLGFGTGNYNDEMMTKISNVGNGNYGYVDSMSEARKILDEEMAATLVTVAKDVKAQIEFNPANVIEYRQLGYEKRQLRNEDFNDDSVDAGDVGAGRRVVILYELTLAGGKPSVDPLRYQPAAASEDFTATDMKRDELAYLKFRWKAADGDTSSKAEMPLMKSALAPSFEKSGTGLRFSAAVAAYGQKLRGRLAETGWDQIEAWADGARGNDPYRAEFLQLVKLAGSIPR
ncbi:MAG: VWA domain-containing protein [Synergistaceae bacterium]|jgi:Ca-activated chloride channel family protein|nr:VWA domain-containing protein [Synergistaceae bacterium]